MTVAAPPPLERAREALAKHEWEDARDLFQEAAAATPLAPSDLVGLGEAAYWSGHPDERVDAFSRAYAGFLEAGEKSTAAGVALRLFQDALFRGSMPVAMGWIARAERLLAEEPESDAHGVRAMFESFRQIELGDFEKGEAEADRALALARQFSNRDLEATALNLKGQALVRRGQLDAGMALIDESTAAAVAGELQPWATANIYCATMGACRDLSDWERAVAWTEEADREMQRQRITGFPGECSVHRARVQRLRGNWAGAEQEARKACKTFEQYQLLAYLGGAYYELGENLRQRGDIAGASEAFQRAAEFGRDPEPGLALIELAEGRPAAATAAMKRALQVGERPLGGTGDNPAAPLGRSHLLPAHVEIALATGDLATAEAAATDLEEIAATFPTTALQASAATARGAVLLAQRDIPAAIAALIRARRGWQVVGAPYEMARVRVQLAAAYRSAGEATNAAVELEAARSTFERLGAVPDLHAVEAELQQHGVIREDAGGRRATRTFMFTDIVTSTELLEALGDSAWDSLIGWHDTTLRALIREHGGQEVSHTGDGFFVAFESAVNAIECAVAIQRRMAAHRSEQGFAPWLRIGLHTAEVSRVAGNYRGVGVHVAARVSGLAGQEQILVSVPTLEAAGAIPYSLSERRSTDLKGIREPVEVAEIFWR